MPVYNLFPISKIILHDFNILGKLEEKFNPNSNFCHPGPLEDKQAPKKLFILIYPIYAHTVSRTQASAILVLISK